MAAQAQDRDGYQGDARVGHARSAGGRGYDASVRVHDNRRGDARYGRVDRYRFAGYRYAGRGHFGGDRSFYRDDRQFRGGVALGFGYGGGYPSSGYAYGNDYAYGPGYAYGDGYPAAAYGADDAYSYPDAYGTYQPFAYDYSDRDDAYYASGEPTYSGGAYGRYAAGPDDSYQATPSVGWSAGGPPVDCGQWIWREGRGAYQWVAAPCPYSR